MFVCVCVWNVYVLVTWCILWLLHESVWLFFAQLSFLFYIFVITLLLGRTASNKMNCEVRVLMCIVCLCVRLYTHECMLVPLICCSFVCLCSHWRQCHHLPGQGVGASDQWQQASWAERTLNRVGCNHTCEASAHLAAWKEETHMLHKYPTAIHCPGRETYLQIFSGQVLLLMPSHQISCFEQCRGSTCLQARQDKNLFARHEEEKKNL